MSTPPDGLGEAGAALWESVLDRFDMDDEDRVLLVQACRTVDVIERLQAVVDAEGVMQPGVDRAHPALVESRQQRLVLAKLIRALGLPDADVSPRQRQVRRRNLAPVS